VSASAAAGLGRPGSSALGELETELDQILHNG
jgi:hypothetical protein